MTGHVNGPCFKREGGDGLQWADVEPEEFENLCRGPVDERQVLVTYPTQQLLGVSLPESNELVPGIVDDVGEPLDRVPLGEQQVCQRFAYVHAVIVLEELNLLGRRFPGVKPAHKARRKERRR